MDLTRWPAWDRLEGKERVLLAGAGGVFDVCSAIPLLVMLDGKGAQVHLANLSFTALEATGAARIHPACWQVDEESTGPDYFPERTLARWLAGRGWDRPVYAFPRTGTLPLREAYRHLVGSLDIDAIVLVDGGTDSLLRGTESELGTPVEDITSIAALQGLGELPRLLMSVAFCVDSCHGVAHAEVLEAVAEYTNTETVEHIHAFRATLRRKARPQIPI